MPTIDLNFSPLYRKDMSLNRLVSLLNNTSKPESDATGYPPYNIEVQDENQYTITLSVAGFSQNELNIQVEKRVLTIRGTKPNHEEKNKHQYLYRGIADHPFEYKFNLADHVEVNEANLNNGLLVINLLKEIPETMKSKTIIINEKGSTTEQKTGIDKAA